MTYNCCHPLKVACCTALQGECHLILVICIAQEGCQTYPHVLPPLKAAFHTAIKVKCSELQDILIAKGCQLFDSQEPDLF